MPPPANVRCEPGLIAHASGGIPMWRLFITPGACAARKVAAASSGGDVQSASSTVGVNTCALAELRTEYDATT